MKKIVLLLTISLCSYGIAQRDQVGINTSDPKATLDIEVAPQNVSGNTKEGILIPKVTATRAKAMGTDVANSTLVFIESGSAESGTTISEIDGAGYYYYDDSVNKWKDMTKGPKGEQGLRGPKGDRGDRGDRGPRGTDAYYAPSGSRGSQGPESLPEVRHISAVITIEDRSANGYTSPDNLLSSYSFGNVPNDSNWVPIISHLNLRRCYGNFSTASCEPTSLSSIDIFYNNGWKFAYREASNRGSGTFIWLHFTVYFVKIN